MKKISFTFILLSSFVTGAANADLLNGATLSFSPHATGGVFSVLPADGQGSWFAMGLSPGSFFVTPVSGINGISLGTTQLANSVLPIPVGNIDTPWLFFGNTGAHQTTSNTNILTTVGDTATIDFSGWSITWNGIPDINMGSQAWNGNADGVADLRCALESLCTDGSTYILDYSAIAEQLEPSGKGGVRYALHLEGFVGAVPVPAAAWLFGSGLLALVGVSYRQKLAS